MTYVSACPICHDLIPNWGPNGIVPHILDEHPVSIEADFIRAELAKS